MGRGISPESKRLMERILEVFRSEHPIGPRRCTYAIVGNRASTWVQKVGQLCGRLLDDGRLPLAWYDDSSRAYVEPYVVEDVEAHAHGCTLPRYDPWKLQGLRVVVWSEKSVGGTLSPVCDRYAVPFLNTSGWQSRKLLMEEARRVLETLRKLVVIYVGDHDASGVRMSEADLPSRLSQYVTGLKGPWRGSPLYEIRRVAVTDKDVKRLRRLDYGDPLKPTDPNARWYREKTGLDFGIELEALPAPLLRKRVATAIEKRTGPVQGAPRPSLWQGDGGGPSSVDERE
jgi:hypothetical protein